MADIGEIWENFTQGARNAYDNVREEAESICNTAREDGLVAAAQQVRDDFTVGANAVSDEAQRLWDEAMEQCEIARAERAALDARISALDSFKTFLQQYKSDADSVRQGIMETTYYTYTDHSETGSGTYMQALYSELTDDYDASMLYFKADAYWDDVCSLKSQVSNDLEILRGDRLLYDGLSWFTPLGIIYI